MILFRDQDRAILTFPGAIQALEPWAIDPALLAGARHVHISSFFLQTGLTPGLGTLLAEVRRRGGSTSVDPNWDPSGRWDGGLRELLADVDVFMPNGVEAVRIAGGGDPVEAAQRLAACGSLVAVKLGADGALAVRTGVEPVRVRSPGRRCGRRCCRRGRLVRRRCARRPARRPAGGAGPARSGAPAVRCRHGLAGELPPSRRSPRRSAFWGGRGDRVIVCVAGNPSIDRLIELEALTPGEIRRRARSWSCPAARACTSPGCARRSVLRRLPQGSWPVTPANWITEALAHEGVVARFAWGPGETRSCLSVADRATGALTEFYEPGTPAPPRRGRIWLNRRVVAELRPLAGAQRIAAARDAGRWLRPANRPRAAAAGVPAVVDSREPWLAAALDAGPALVKINAYEASELLEEPVARAASAASRRRGRSGIGPAATVTR